MRRSVRATCRSPFARVRAPRTPRRPASPVNRRRSCPAAVSGAVTPDHYIIKRNGRVRKAHVHQQPYAIVPAEAGGVVEQELDPDEGAARKAGDELLAELARLGDQLEQRVGVPQDIEWA